MKKPSKEEIDVRKETSRLRLMSDREFFTSKAFADYMYLCLKAIVMAKKARGIKIALFADPNGDIASTNSETVRVNAANPLIEEKMSRMQKYEILTGIAVHEFAHILYTDFSALKDLVSRWKNGDKPQGIADRVWEDIQTKGKEFSNYCLQAFLNFENLFDDCHVEWKIHRNFAGFPSITLHLTRKAARKFQQPIDDLFGSASEVNIVFMMFLSTIGGTKVKWREELSISSMYPDKYSEVHSLYEDLEPYWMELKGENDYGYRHQRLGEAFNILYPFLKKEYEERKEEERSGEGGKENSEESGHTDSNTETGENGKDGTAGISGADRTAKEDDGSKNDGSLKTLKKEAGVAPLPEAPHPKKGKSSRTSEGSVPETEGDLEETIARTLSEDKRRGDEAERLAEELNEYNDGKRTFRFSKQKATIGAKSVYQLDRKLVEATINNTVRVLDRVLKERKRGGKVKGQLIGKKIDCSRAFRDKNRIFVKELGDEGNPNVAFGILVDESGSMCEEENGLIRATAARRAAIAMDAVLRKMEIPHCIVGHSAGWDGENPEEVEFLEYVNFDSYEEKEMYSLGNIHDRGNNHDLAALLHMENLLRRRNEARILMVISDGIPLAPGFSGYPAILKTREAVDKMKKNGITVIAACIAGIDNERLKMIYGEESVMDITDLNQLSQKMMKVLKKQILTRRAR